MTFNRYSIVILILLIITTYTYYFRMGNIQEVPIARPLDEFPASIGKWKLYERVELKKNVVDILGVDTYKELIYFSPENEAIDLYISYFNILKEGKQFHSPKNCLIGSGSTLIRTESVNVPLGNGHRAVPMSLMILQKGDIRQYILYWFQCRGRITSSEYRERIYRVLDAVFKKRTDGAFIRISCSRDIRDEKDAERDLVDFTSHAIPILKQFIPDA